MNQLCLPRAAPPSHMPLGQQCPRRRGREAEGGGLLNRYRVSSPIEGSNPSVSASRFKSAERPLILQTGESARHTGWARVWGQGLSKPALVQRQQPLPVPFGGLFIEAPAS